MPPDETSASSPAPPCPLPLLPWLSLEGWEVFLPPRQACLFSFRVSPALCSALACFMLSSALAAFSSPAVPFGVTPAVAWPAWLPVAPLCKGGNGGVFAHDWHPRFMTWAWLWPRKALAGEDPLQRMCRGDSSARLFLGLQLPTPTCPLSLVGALLENSGVSTGDGGMTAVMGIRGACREGQIPAPGCLQIRKCLSRTPGRTEAPGRVCLSQEQSQI